MFNLCKLGKSINIPDRDSTYITSEIERGYFYPIISVNINFLDQIEKELQNEFINYHIYKGGGTEFYSIEIILKIISGSSIVSSSHDNVNV
jgi:hypothetical protein